MFQNPFIEIRNMETKSLLAFAFLLLNSLAVHTCLLLAAPDNKISSRNITYAQLAQ